VGGEPTVVLYHNSPYRMAMAQFQLWEGSGVEVTSINAIIAKVL
jgi:hypothetical protein